MHSPHCTCTYPARLELEHRVLVVGAPPDGHHLVVGRVAEWAGEGGVPHHLCRALARLHGDDRSLAGDPLSEGGRRVEGGGATGRGPRLWLPNA